VKNESKKVGTFGADLFMTMNKLCSGLALCAVLVFTQCSSPLDPYPMDKKYWGAKDYDEVLTYIKFRLPQGDQYPNINDALTSPVFQKLVDKENLAVVLEDKSLGVKHREEFATAMREQVSNMIEIYSVLDREDKFVYDQELAQILNMFMYLETIYFSLGNEDIRQGLDKTNETRLNDLIRSNENICIKNFAIYLDYVNRENSFSTDAIDLLSDGYSKYVPALITTFPDGDYKPLKVKTEGVLAKATSPKLKAALKTINDLLESKIPTVPTEAAQ
jgi:hypothetical protein